MKKVRLLLLTLASASLCLVFTACGHTHEYGDWSVETAPTETAEGEARRYCTADDEYETFPLPALSNTEFWQKSETPAAHDTDGSAVYTSEYGTVTVVLPKEGHTYDGSAWTVTAAPTETAEGEARRYCTANDGGCETMPLPKLSESDWTVETVTEPSHTQDGVTKYTLKADASVFFEVTQEKLAEHVYGSWTVEKAPTMTETGTAAETCIAGDDTQNMTLPALSDTEFWTKSETAPTVTATGEIRYTNEENNLTVKIDTVLIYTSENGENTARTVAAGESFSAFLPSYTVDEENRLQFLGWYLDATFTSALDVNRLVTVQDNGDTVYGRWAALPVYYGTYNGNQLSSGSSAANNTATLTVNAEGVITGTVRKNNADCTIGGSVENYDEAKGIITCRTGSATFYLWIERESGMIAMASEWESATAIGAYPYLFTRDGSTFNETVCFNFYGGEAADQPYTYFVSYGNGGEYALIYTDKLYVGVTAENYLGEEIALSEVTASATLIFKSGEDVIVAFGKSGTTYVALDGCYGVYTVADETEVKFDGLGNFVYGDKTGIYSAAAAAEYLELYVRTAHVETETDEGGNTTETVTYTNTEYYRATFDGDACTLVKPMVQITYVTAHGTASDEKANVNIAFTLPVLTEDNCEFLGWYFDAAYENAVGSVYTFTTDDGVTLYAKWTEHVVLTVVFNDGETADEIYGDIAIGGTKAVDVPYYAKHKFEGWYTTATFDEGTEWISGETAIDTDTTIYAKWSDAHAMYGTYVGFNLFASASGETITSFNSTFSVDADGTVTGGSTNGKILDYNEETGVFHYGTNGKYGFYNAESRIIAEPYSGTVTSGLGIDMNIYFSKEVTSVAVSSNLATAAGSWTSILSVTYSDGSTELIAIYDNKVYSGIVWEATDASGEAITDVTGVTSGATVTIKTSSDEVLYTNAS